LWLCAPASTGMDVGERAGAFTEGRATGKPPAEGAGAIDVAEGRAL
jgi:hypothetical protein